MSRPNYSLASIYERQIHVVFYTSNVDKILQARTVFGRVGYALRVLKNKTEPYDESYEDTKEDLLARAVSQVREEFQVRTAFFVEDTSVRIDALSSDAIDSPGLRVKEWFAETTFGQFDRLLRARGNDRTTTIKSDIALSLPNLQRPIFIHGETRGRVADTPPRFSKNLQYPWLTPDTFNGWFIPDGATKRLGEMEFEESWQYDFRIRSLVQLIARLEELNCALNLPSYSYGKAELPVARQQFNLLPQTQAVVVVIGQKCAGKSTLADYLVQRREATWYEASRILQGILQARGVEISTGREILGYLRANGMGLVAREIIRRMQINPAPLTIITGLRTIEEIHALLSELGNVIIVCVGADQRIRFERHIRRGRDEDVGTSNFQKFREQDEEQCQFGLLRVAREIADVSIENDGSMAEFHRKIDDVMSRIERSDIPEPATHTIIDSELYRTLAALADLDRRSTCKDIAAATSRFGAKVRLYNTNRALKAVPEFAKRYDTGRGLLKYEPLESGKVFVRVCELLRRGPLSMQFQNRAGH